MMKRKSDSELDLEPTDTKTNVKTYEESHPLFNLCYDVIEKIGTYLSYTDLAGAAASCRFFKDNLSASLRARKHIQLATDKVENIFILRADGRVLACGKNTEGQLGLEDTTPKATLTLIPDLKDVARIYCAERYTLFLKKDHSLWACGSIGHFLANGQVWSDKDWYNRISLKPIPLPGIDNVKKIIDFGAHFLFYLKNDDTVWACGFDDSFEGPNLPDTDKWIPPHQVADIPNVAQFHQASYANLVVQKDGYVWLCPSESFLNLPPGEAPYLKITNLQDVHRVYNCSLEGGDTGFAWKKDGTMLQLVGLKLNEQTKHRYLQALAKLEFIEYKKIQKAYMNDKDCYGFWIDEEGTVFALGEDYRGKLGLGVEDKERTINNPTVISSLCKVRKIFSRLSHTFFLTEEGDLYACGDNEKGELGTGEVTKASDIKKVLLTNVDHIEIGYSYTLFTRANRIWVAGKVESLGLGDKIITRPTEIDLYNNCLIENTETSEVVAEALDPAAEALLSEAFLPPNAKFI